MFMYLLDDKLFLRIVGTLFAFISAIHLVRAVFSWNFYLGIYEIPISWSYYASFLTFILSSVSFSLSKEGVKSKNVKRNR